MILNIIKCISAIALLSFNCVGSAQQPGEAVLAQWQGGQYWFPGVVESRTDKTITVAYDDGDRDTRPADQVKFFDWQVGSRVHCLWAGGSNWYAGRITAIEPGISKISIAYDDGDREETQTASCRSV